MVRFMNTKRKRRNYNTRKIIVFIIFAIAALILPTRFIIDDVTRNGWTIQAPDTIYGANGAVYDGVAGMQANELADSGQSASKTKSQSDSSNGAQEHTETPGDASLFLASSKTDQQSYSELPVSAQQPANATNSVNSANAANAAGAANTANVAGAANDSNKPVDEEMAGFIAENYMASSFAKKYISAGQDAQDIDAETGDAGARDLPPENIVITISAVGDCTIGYDETFGYQNRFDQVYAANNGDPAYFFMNVVDIFSDDDLTIANLENVFTKATKKADKAYRFKGPPEYVKILEEGSIEAVNLANNHMFDYFQKGYEDTIETLNNSSVRHFGYENRIIIEAKGIKIGLAGFHIGGGGWSGKKNDITNALEALRSEADIVVVSFHWGIEGKYQQSGDQSSLAHYAIDNGADLVLGHHTHTLQPIEIYKERTIAYSLGNFCFGGNRNPSDKDSIILRQSFVFDGEKLELLETPGPEIIPVSISSVKDRNDYRPTVVEGADAERVMKKVKM